MEKRYPALRLIGGVYKLLGIITGVFTLILLVLIPLGHGAIFGALSNDVRGGGIGAVYGTVLAGFVLVRGAIAAVTLLAIGEGILLGLVVEENTHGTAVLLQQQASRSLTLGDARDRWHALGGFRNRSAYVRMCPQIITEGQPLQITTPPWA